MFLRRIAQTVGAVAAVAFCADNNNVRPKFLRQNSGVEKRASFRSYAKEIDSRAYQLYTDTDWKKYQTSKEVTISHKKSPDRNDQVYRLDVTVNSPLESVVAIIQDPKHQRESWDPDLKEYVIEEAGEGVTIIHTVYHTTGIVAKLVSPREFCQINLLRRHEDGTVSKAYNRIDHPGCEPMDGFVRGDVYTSGMFCTPCKEDSNKTRITLIYQSDAKVYVPGYILHVTNCRRGFEMAELLKRATETDEA